MYGRKTPCRHCEQYAECHAMESLHRRSAHHRIDISRNMQCCGKFPIKVSKDRLVSQELSANYARYAVLPLRPEKARKLAAIYLNDPKKTFTYQELISIQAISRFDFLERKRKERLYRLREERYQILEDNVNGACGRYRHKLFWVISHGFWEK